MAKQGSLALASTAEDRVEAKITPIVIFSCVLASTGGLMFGYEVAISGQPLRFSLTYKIKYPQIIYRLF